ncbi:hypothetical protein ACNKHV_12225 [Shigella flexneri]
MTSRTPLPTLRGQSSTVTLCSSRRLAEAGHLPAIQISVDQPRNDGVDQVSNITRECAPSTAVVESSA